MELTPSEQVMVFFMLFKGVGGRLGFKQMPSGEILHTQTQINHQKRVYPHFPPYPLIFMKFLLTKCSTYFFS